MTFQIKRLSKKKIFHKKTNKSEVTSSKNVSLIIWNLFFSCSIWTFLKIAYSSFTRIFYLSSVMDHMACISNWRTSSLWSDGLWRWRTATYQYFQNSSSLSVVLPIRDRMTLLDLVLCFFTTLKVSLDILLR